jgi:hypothetical protein
VAALPEGAVILVYMLSVWRGGVMKFGSALFCFLILLTVTTVRAQDVAVDFDKSVDFSKFKTYSWTIGAHAKNPFIDEKIKATVEEQLAARGLRRIDEAGDLSVLYIAAVDRDVQFSTSRWEQTGDWMRQAQYGISVGSQLWDVEIGVLAVCFSDATGKKLLWRGTSRTMLDKRSKNKNAMAAMVEDARRVEKKVRKAVEKMFKQYPVAKDAR